MFDKLPNTSYREFLLWIFQRRRRFRVTGVSMQPLLQPGEEILINPYAYQNNLPQVNDLVVAIHPEQEGLEIVKRISTVTEDGRFFLLGDNSIHSSDSRSFGAVSLNQIRGKVTCRFS